MDPKKRLGARRGQKSAGASSMRCGVCLFRNTDEQGAGQFTVCAGDRCVVASTILTEDSSRSAVGAFFGQRFVGWAITVQSGIGGRFSIFHQSSVGSDEVLAVIGKDGCVELRR